MADYGPAALSFYRGHGGEAFSSGDAALLNALSAHLVLAARSTWEARARGFHGSLLREALDSINTAVFAVDGNGRLLLANRVGESLIRSEQRVRVVRGSIVVANVCAKRGPWGP
jgi:hypothetical protein